jgi:ABC-type transport system involved in multi-copper enzyme maturation permease subunit
MSAHTTATRPRTGPALVALFRYSLRTSLSPKRRSMLLGPCVATVLFGMIATTFDGDPARDFARIAAIALFGLVLPVTALVVGDAVLGTELRRGAFTFTWMSPVPTWQIVLARWASGTLVAGGSLALSFAIAALVAGTPDSAAPAAIAVAFGAASYVAIFMAIGCIAQRAAVWSLAFVFLVERLLGSALSGIAQLSPTWESRAAFVGMADVQRSLERHGIPHGTGALIRLSVITLVALVVAVRQLPRMKMAGSTD